MLIAASLFSAVSLVATIPVFNAVGDSVVLERDTLLVESSSYYIPSNSVPSHASEPVESRVVNFQFVGRERLGLLICTDSASCTVTRYLERMSRDHRGRDFAEGESIQVAEVGKDGPTRSSIRLKLDRLTPLYVVFFCYESGLAGGWQESTRISPDGKPAAWRPKTMRLASIYPVAALPRVQQHPEVVRVIGKVTIDPVANRITRLP